MNWSPPPRPFDYAEEALVTAILDGTFSPGSTLPGERDLAAQLGITRPTLRAVLGRLSRDGWLTIQQGKPTRVNDYWSEGGLNVLSALVRYSQELPSDFVLNLLAVRLAMAPAYARAAIERNPEDVIAYLKDSAGLDDTPQVFAAFDWRLHHALTLASGNPVYTLILNGFAGFYEQMAARYFARPKARAASQTFYTHLLEVALRGDSGAAEQIVCVAMQESVRLWKGDAKE